MNLKFRGESAESFAVFASEGIFRSSDLPAFSDHSSLVNGFGLGG